MEGKFHRALIAFVQAIVRVGQLGQHASAGIMVGMHLGVDHMADFDIRFLRFVEEPFLVTRYHVYRHRFTERAAAKKIGEGRFFGRQLLEKQGYLRSVSDFEIKA